MKVDANKLVKNNADSAFSSLMGNREKKIHISEIRENPYNEFQISEANVKKLAMSIYANKQIQNISVYEDDLGDGKKYTLLSGATRYRAVSLLFSKNTSEQTFSDGYLVAAIEEKPKSSFEEKLLIVEANSQRDMSDEDYYFIIKTYEEEYDKLKAQGNRPDIDRRDYVGRKMGKSGRWVTIMKNKIEGKSEKTQRKEKSSRQAYNKVFARKISKNYKLLTSVTSKSITFKCTDTEELNELLAHFGIDMKYDYHEEEE